ncbi:MAG TPA: DUF3592 domain-containing protein [Acidimicrobiales bacterium]|nr:DUF3592 domain-containing protein [Acidimicrobiales bacterium]
MSTSSRRPGRREAYLTDPAMAPARRRGMVVATVVVGVLFALLSAGAVVGALVERSHQRSLAAHGVLGSGVVAAVSPADRGAGDLTVEVAADGRNYAAHISAGRLLPVGRHVAVRYDTTDPSNAELVGADAQAARAAPTSPSTWVAVAVICAVLLVADVVVGVRVARRSRRDDEA